MNCARLIWNAKCDEHRFIPTVVGNTAWLPRSPCRRTVHPHSRGEHTAPTFTITDSTGSSPRSWGTLYTVCYLGASPRFIPTVVGNTFRPTDTGDCANPAVHPHGRGEHYQRGLRRRFIPTVVGNTQSNGQRGCGLRRGSSPRSWGTPKTAVQDSSPRPVHPHGRGEHTMLFLRGSNRVRFIPTVVGNTD